MGDKEKLGEIVKKLEHRQGELLNTLISRDDIYHPEVILKLVWEIRSIKNLLELLNEK